MFGGYTEVFPVFGSSLASCLVHRSDLNKVPFFETRQKLPFFCPLLIFLFCSVIWCLPQAEKCLG